MKMSEFVAELQKIMDEEYSDLGISIYADRGQWNVAVSTIDITDSFAIHLEEWKRNDSIGKETLIRERIKTMLCELRDMINTDIERIENAETSHKRSDKT